MFTRKTCIPDPIFLQTHCRRIFFRNLALSCSIGVYDHEKANRQQLTLDCDVWALKYPVGTDSLEAVLDYDRIGAILRQAAVGHTNLQETLVDRLIKQIAALPSVVLVRLASAKPDAYPDADAIGIEEWRVGESFSKTFESDD